MQTVSLLTSLQHPHLPSFPSPALPEPQLTVHIKLNGGLPATGDGLVHAAAGEDTPNVQVRGVDEQLADSGLPLPVLQQLLGWDQVKAVSGKSPSCSQDGGLGADSTAGCFNLKLIPVPQPLLGFCSVFN